MSKTTFIVFVLVAGLLIVSLFSGCAGINVNENGDIKAYGFFRTVTEKKAYYQNGQLKEHVVSTDSTSKDVLLGLDKLLDSAFNTATKAMP